jgi:predicted lipoprotein
MSYKKLFQFIGLITCLSLLSACTVTDLDADGNPIIPKDPNAKISFADFTLPEVADQLWEPKVFPEATQEFTSWESIKSQIDAQEITTKQSFFVRLDGTVKSVDMGKMKGLITMNVGDTDIMLQVGRIIKGNAIRDASKYVVFDDFKNQIRFAQISRQFNNRAMASIGKPDPSWAGKKATVIAAITVDQNTIKDAVPMQISFGGK